MLRRYVIQTRYHYLEEKQRTSGETLDGGDGSVLDERELRNFDELDAVNGLGERVAAPLHHHVLHRVAVCINSALASSPAAVAATLEHSNSGKKSFDSIRFDSRYRIDFFDSIRFGNLINLPLVH